MTAAVRMAAELLKYTERKASVILVSDGIETCGLDPCAVAEELEKLGVDLTVHTVGFGLDDQGAVAQLKCLAEKTGGTYTTAENASELEAALTKTVEAVPAPPPEPAAPAFNVTGHVVMAEGVELSQGYELATWEFFDVVDGQKGQWIQTEYGTDIKINLPRTGDFIVRVSDDVAAVELPMTLEAGEVEKLNVSLEAGILRLSGMMDETTAMTDAGAAWELLDLSGKWITTKYGAETAFLANAGVYKVRLSLGTAKVEQDIEIAAGKLSEQKLALGAGVHGSLAVFSSTAGRRFRREPPSNCARLSRALTESMNGSPPTMAATRASRFRPESISSFSSKDYAERLGSGGGNGSGHCFETRSILRAAIWRSQAPRIQPLKYFRRRRIFPAHANTSPRNFTARQQGLQRGCLPRQLPNGPMARFSARRIWW